MAGLISARGATTRGEWSAWEDGAFLFIGLGGLVVTTRSEVVCPALTGSMGAGFIALSRERITQHLGGQAMFALAGVSVSTGQFGETEGRVLPSGLWSTCSKPKHLSS